jgi:hypothetical protein
MVIIPEVDTCAIPGVACALPLFLMYAPIIVRCAAGLAQTGSAVFAVSSVDDVPDVTTMAAVIHTITALPIRTTDTLIGLDVPPLPLNVNVLDTVSEASLLTNPILSAVAAPKPTATPAVDLTTRHFALLTPVQVEPAPPNVAASDADLY